MFSVILLKAMFCFCNLVIVSMRCFNDLPSLSSLHTTRVSPALKWDNACSNPTRCAFVPVILSVKMFFSSQPAFFRLSTCKSRFCSFLGTILQKYKIGNEKVMDMLSDQAIPRIAVSHF